MVLLNASESLQVFDKAAAHRIKEISNKILILLRYALSMYIQTRYSMYVYYMFVLLF